MTLLRNSPSGKNLSVSPGPDVIIDSLGLNGSTPVTQVLVPADHEPGMYLIYRSLVRRASGTSGTMNTTVTWSDGIPLSSTNPQNLNGPVPAYLQPGVLQVHSDGSAAIVCAITFTSPVGSPSMDVTSWATFVGED